MALITWLKHDQSLYRFIMVYNVKPCSAMKVTVGQWVAAPSVNQGVGGSIPALVDVLEQGTEARASPRSG